MSEEISAGVRILLERAKSNPEEMIEDYGKWGQLRDAVFEYVERGERRAWIRGLRQDEINLLYEMFSNGSRQVFDNYVMKSVLGTDGEEEGPKERFRLSSQGNLGIGTIQPGSWQNVVSQTSNKSITLQGNTTVQGTFDAEPSPSFVQKIKSELGL
jgi:hypothetical protein